MSNLRRPLCFERNPGAADAASRHLSQAKNTAPLCARDYAAKSRARAVYWRIDGRDHHHGADPQQASTLGPDSRRWLCSAA